LGTGIATGNIIITIIAMGTIIGIIAIDTVGKRIAAWIQPSLVNATREGCCITSPHRTLPGVP
jgi:hypothetical protein